MSSEAVLQDIGACVCASIGAPDHIRFCEECHRYWRGDKQLLSVSKVLRSTWPFKPDYSAARPEVIENARDRGCVVDSLFTSYVKGRLQAIPRGTREDAVELFFRLKRWWDARNVESVQSQVILADDDVAGMCDLIADDWIYDLKTTHDIEPMYQLQLGAYAQLHFATFQRPAKGLGIIHLTKRFSVPKLIKIDMVSALQDWAALRECYQMAVRRTNGTTTKSR